ncbi:MaoC-like domain-containing protein [Cinnamomum micranthum f. kanehirae]|uniref:MaoC-like domain-containing protein n=1 Tax=Cinnamomum micranthum f. kanehirae TaxID=337451 RepID=A0A443PU76_9MAGN|nr:MaoC-like domain-containing protein [Cinnamomum micranthum f. kanehirae]
MSVRLVIIDPIDSTKNGFVISTEMVLPCRIFILLSGAQKKNAVQVPEIESWRPFLTLSPSISITSSYSYSSVSSTSHLKIGDVLKKSQKFSHQDVLQFSNLTHDSNPLHFDSQSARDAGFRDCIVHGMLVAALFPRTIASYFVSC